MAHESSATSRLLVATKDGVAVIDHDESKRAWKVTAVTLRKRHVSALLYEPTGRRIFAATHGHGIYSSDDLGASWADASEGLSIRNVFSLASSVKSGKTTLLAGTEPVMLFTSTDDGLSWRSHPALERIPDRDKWTFPAPPHVAHLKSIAVHPKEPDVYYACIEQGALLKSTDAGKSWHEITSYIRPDDRWYRDIHKIVPSSSDPRRMLMTTGFGVYRTADAGVTWEKLDDSSFPIGYPDHLVVSPLDENKVFVSGASASPDIWRQTGAAKAMVICSMDGGTHWQVSSDGLPVSGRSAIEAMSAANEPDRFTLFVANTDGEVYASHDEAASWTKIADGLAPVAKSVHADHIT